SAIVSSYKKVEVAIIVKVCELGLRRVTIGALEKRRQRGSDEQRLFGAACIFEVQEVAVVLACHAAKEKVEITIVINIGEVQKRGAIVCVIDRIHQRMVGFKLFDERAIVIPEIPDITVAVCKEQVGIGIVVYIDKLHTCGIPYA